MAGLGRPWALATSYDIAFLHLILAALEGAPVESRPCTAFRFKDVPVRRLSTPSSHWLAAVNVLLMAEKCHDDILDENSLKGRIGLALLDRQVLRAEKTMLETCFEVSVISGLHRRQAAVESLNAASLESLALPTGIMLGEIFAHISVLTQRPELRPALLHLGQGLAAVIYLRDALDDINKDLSRNRFNAVDKALGPDFSRSNVLAIVKREWRRAKLGLEMMNLDSEDFNVALGILEGLHPNARRLSVQTNPGPQRTGTRGVCELFLCCDASICCECGTSAGVEACCSAGACPCDCAICCGSAKNDFSAASPKSEPTPKPALPCPTCGLSLKSKLYEGWISENNSSHSVELDECTHCGGLWFDQGELEKVASFDELPQRLWKPLTTSRPPLRPEGTRPCPHCAEIMVGTLIKAVRVDLCSTCKGMWLDQGELNKLLED